MPHSVKSCKAMDAVISTAATCLLAVRQASFRRHELYLGSFMELGNLNIDDRLLTATVGFAGSQRETHDKINLKAEYQSNVSGTD